MPSQIYLLRHGETEWSLSGRHTGITDIPLTARGEEEARTAGRELKGITFDRVLTSPRLRARRTVELAGFATQAEVDDNLREWTYGEYEGLLIDEIRARHPGWNIFEHGCPGGESPEQVSKRAEQLLGSLEKITGNVLLVCHGHFTRVLATQWIKLPLIYGRLLGSNTGSISRLGINGNDPQPVLLLWNQVPSS